MRTDSADCIAVQEQWAVLKGLPIERVCGFLLDRERRAA